MHDKNKDTKTFNITGEICFKWLFTVLPRGVFRTQPKVCGGASFQKQLTIFEQLTFFTKKPPINAGLLPVKKRNKLSYRFTKFN